MKTLNYESTYEALKLDFETFKSVLIPASNSNSGLKLKEYIIASALDYTSPNAKEKEDFYFDRLKTLLTYYGKKDIENTIKSAKNEFNILVTYITKYK
jgi:hypothetical protein